MAARDDLQVAISHFESVHVEEDAHEAQGRILFGVRVAVPAGAVIAAGPIQRHTVVEADVLTQDAPRQIEHLRVVDEAGQVLVVLGAVVIGAVLFVAWQEGLDTGQSGGQTFAGFRGEEPRKDEVTVHVELRTLGGAEGNRLEESRWGAHRKCGVPLT